VARLLPNVAGLPDGQHSLMRLRHSPPPRAPAAAISGRCARRDRPVERRQDAKREGVGSGHNRSDRGDLRIAAGRGHVGRETRSLSHQLDVGEDNVVVRSVQLDLEPQQFSLGCHTRFDACAVVRDQLVEPVAIFLGLLLERLRERDGKEALDRFDRDRAAREHQRRLSRVDVLVGASHTRPPMEERFERIRDIQRRLRLQI
jgi:hypothetical protein